MEKARQTILEMLKDRQFNVECINDDVTVIDEKLIVYFCKENKLGISAAKRIEALLEEYRLNHIICIYNNSVTSHAKKEIDSGFGKQGINVELFLIDDLQFNITKHSLVPKHILLNKKFKKELLKFYNITEIQLPLIHLSDPICQYYGAKRGDLFKIERETVSNFTSPYFRLVI